MLNELIYDIPYISMLNSDEVVYTLLEEISKPREKKDTYKNSINSSIENFYKNRYSLAKVEYAQQSISNNIKNKDYDFLDKLCDDFFDIDVSHLYIKREMLTIASSTMRHVHPFFITGYKLAKSLKENKNYINRISTYTKNITYLGYKNSNDKEYIDLHLHIGAGSDTLLNIYSIFEDSTNEHKYINNLPNVSRYRYIDTNQLPISKLIKILHTSHSIINRYILDKSSVKSGIKAIESIYRGINSPNISSMTYAKIDIYSKLFQSNNDILYTLLCMSVKEYNEGNIYKSFFLYTILLYYIYIENDDIQGENKSETIYIKKVIMLLIHIINILRSYMNMSQNVGLSYFSQYSNSSLRDKNIENALDIIYSSGTTYAELKMTPHQIEAKLAQILKKSKQLNKDNNFQISVHFIREDDFTKKNILSENIRKEYRYKKLSIKLQAEAEELKKVIYSPKKSLRSLNVNNKIATIDDIANTQYIDVGKYIRSIDVASDERKTPPEIFAPAIRYLRDINYDEIQFLEYRKPLRISVHAGEEFDFIVTGMRRIDESLEFYDMTSDDRLGHALAIGIDTHKWFDNNKNEIYIKQGDYLDNIVWLYNTIQNINPKGFDTSSILHKYKTKIKEYSKKVYGKVIDEYILHEAWKLRKYSAYHTSIVKTSSYSYLKKGYYKYAIIPDMDKKPVETNLFCRYNSNEYKEKGMHNVITITHKKEYQDRYTEYISQDEIDIYTIVQDYLIQKISDKNISIETNPSSNIYTSQLDCYTKHPIFRWYPMTDKKLKIGKKYNRYGIRNGRVKVTINSDDPAIFNTSLANEYELIKKAALDLGECELSVNSWLDSIKSISRELYNL